MQALSDALGQEDLEKIETEDEAKAGCEKQETIGIVHGGNGSYGCDPGEDHPGVEGIHQEAAAEDLPVIALADGGHIAVVAGDLDLFNIAIKPNGKKEGGADVTDGFFMAHEACQPA